MEKLNQLNRFQYGKEPFVVAPLTTFQKTDNVGTNPKLSMIWEFPVGPLIKGCTITGPLMSGERVPSRETSFILQLQSGESNYCAFVKGYIPPEHLTRTTIGTLPAQDMVHSDGPIHPVFVMSKMDLTKTSGRLTMTVEFLGPRDCETTGSIATHGSGALYTPTERRFPHEELDKKIAMDALIEARLVCRYPTECALKPLANTGNTILIYRNIPAFTVQQIKAMDRCMPHVDPKNVGAAIQFAEASSSAAAAPSKPPPPTPLHAKYLPEAYCTRLEVRPGVAHEEPPRLKRPKNLPASAEAILTRAPIHLGQTWATCLIPWIKDVSPTLNLLCDKAAKVLSKKLDWLVIVRGRSWECALTDSEFIVHLHRIWDLQAYLKELSQQTERHRFWERGLAETNPCQLVSQWLAATEFLPKGYPQKDASTDQIQAFVNNWMDTEFGTEEKGPTIRPTPEWMKATTDDDGASSSSSSSDDEETADMSEEDDNTAATAAAAAAAAKAGVESSLKRPKNLPASAEAIHLGQTWATSLIQMLKDASPTLEGAAPDQIQAFVNNWMDTEFGTKDARRRSSTSSSDADDADDADDDDDDDEETADMLEDEDNPAATTATAEPTTTTD